MPMCDWSSDVCSSDLYQALFSDPKSHRMKAVAFPTRNYGLWRTFYILRSQFQPTSSPLSPRQACIALSCKPSCAPPARNNSHVGPLGSASSQPVLVWPFMVKPLPQFPPLVSASLSIIPCACGPAQARVASTHCSSIVCLVLGWEFCARCL